jgi:hypothetical protein
VDSDHREAKLSMVAAGAGAGAGAGINQAAVKQSNNAFTQTTPEDFEEVFKLALVANKAKEEVLIVGRVREA